MVRILLSIALLFTASLNVLRADTPAASPETRLAALQKIAAGLHYQQGEVTLRGGLAKIKLPADFRYLDPKDTATVLTDIWGNPPSSAQTLGMLVPADAGVASMNGWGVIITYEENGYVKDNDASKINYDDLLKQMKEGTAEASKQREKKGYPPMELIGWAAPPRYDAASHKLYWAKELGFGGGPHTLNYDIRMLGRRGVLVLNAVAGMDQLADIEKEAPAILSMVDFQEGHRYVDFNPSTDKVATYGLAALVAGGVLAKAGFFKVLIAGILALKKFILIGFVAAAGAIKKLWAKITGRDKPPTLPG